MSKRNKITKTFKDVISEKITFYGIIVTSIVGMIFSVLYYCNSGNSNIFFIILKSVMNTMKMLVFSPIISLGDAKDLMGLYPELTYAYGLSIIVGPACMLTTIIVSFFSFAHNMSRKWYIFAKKRVYIFGYNKETIQLVSRLSEEGMNVIWIVREQLNKGKKEGILFKNKVYLIEKDIVSLRAEDDIEEDIKHVRRFLKENRIDGAKAIILYEKDEGVNFELYLKLSDYFEGKEKSCPVSVYSQNDYISKQIDRLNSKKEISQNGDAVNQKQALNICFFNMYDIAVQKLFDEHFVYEDKLDNKDYDLHFLLIGFGNYGKMVLKQMIHRSVLSHNNNVVIDVLDKNIKEKINDVKRFISEETYESDNMSIRIKDAYVDGTFEIRFHETDVRYREFLDTLKNVNHKKVDYVVIALSDLPLTLQCKEEVRKELGEETIIALQFDEGDMIYHKFERDNKNVQKALDIPFGNLKEILTYENIFRTNIMNKAKEKHDIYIKDNNNKTEWKDLSFQGKMDNYYSAIYEKIYCKKVELAVLDKNDTWESFVQGCTGKNHKEIRESMENNIYYDLCGMEHKRWLLNKWLNGYCYSSDNRPDSNIRMKSFSMLDSKDIIKNGKYLPRDIINNKEN